MPRSLLRQTVSLAAALSIAATALFGIASWRRAQDTAWCREATGGPAAHQAAPSEDLERQRSSCVAHRRDQRVVFGSVWRTGGRTMAECGFDLARLQLVSDPAARAAILEAHGFDPAGFDAGSRADQSRFIEECSSSRR